LSDLYTRFIEEALHSAKQYSDPKILAKCKAAIPEYLYEGEVPPEYLVRILAAWFRTKFMKWANYKIIRYNRISVLLRTRKGRCGEWANLFTAMLISLGIEARLIINVLDDHVWTEAKIKGKWTRIDPTLRYPDSYDYPYFYWENPRWYHKIYQVLAFSSSEVVDVTERYRP